MFNFSLKNVLYFLMKLQRKLFSDDWSRKAKDWGKTGLKVTLIAGAAVGSGAGIVAATPAFLGLLGFTSSGVAAGKMVLT
jgi:hypothetical protein